MTQTIEHLIRPILEQNQFDLVESQYRREAGRWVLRIFIDKRVGEGQNPPGAVTLADCEKISNLLGDLLDSSNVLNDSYTLEISSPGINQPLKSVEDFRRFLGQKVKVSLFAPLSAGTKQKNFAGPLLAAGERAIEVNDIVSGKTEIPIDVIAKAHLDLI